MHFLILSDIHANQQALDAVLAEARGYDSIVCLGDLVGYGADPNSVTQWVRQNVKATIRGNHDRAALGDPVIGYFNDAAQSSAIWTIAHLRFENSQYLEQLPAGPMAVENFYLVHGSPIDEDEYITSRNDASHVYDHMPGDIVFFGHSHLQGAFGMRKGRTWVLDPPEDSERERVHVLEPDSSYLINPGSVGQPRDSDPRAAYALFDNIAKVVTFHRVTYDVAAAGQRILDAGLPEHHAYRLELGH